MSAGIERFSQRILLAAAAMAAPVTAMAHSAERGLVMLLPTGFAITGGGIAVLASFLLLALAPRRLLGRIIAARLPLWTQRTISPLVPSLVSFAVLSTLVLAGFTASEDPLANPLPLTIWTLWWVGFTLLQFLVGDLWKWCNPWYAPGRLAAALGWPAKAPLTLPAGLGYLPALLLFFGFAWFELVHAAPEDPAGLAAAVLVYWTITFAGILAFGYRDWMHRAEPFTIFFRLVGNCSPLLREPVEGESGDPAAGPGRVRVSLGWPGQGFLRQAPLPWTGMLFVLLALSSNSFDGLSRTFAWLALGGINPLEFPGRSAVTGFNTAGLAGAFVALALLFLAAVMLGRSAGPGGPERPAPGAMAGRLVYSIVPIAVAFHIAHYLTQLMVNGQYALQAFTDPFALGWNLFGLGPDFHVTTSFLNNLHSVSVIWGFQTGVIVLGHIIGILLAHLIALELYGRSPDDTRAAVRSQWFLALLMVGYTVFGLWLLSTASVG